MESNVTFLSAGFGVNESEVDASLSHERGVIAEFQYLAIADDGDLVCVLDRRQPMRDRDRSTTLLNDENEDNKSQQ